MIFKTLKASEYCDSVRDGTHDSPKKVEKGYKLITSKNIKEYGLDLDNASEISEMDYKKVNERSLVEKNDILYSMIGTIGLIHRVNYEPKYAIKNMGLFKIKDEQKSKWLYYYLKTPKMKNYINSLLAGSTQQYITLNNLRELPTNTIKFSDFNEIGSLVMGQSPKGSSYNEEKIGLPLINGAADYKDGMLNPNKYTSEPTRVCNAKDLVFCIRATIGQLTIANQEYCLGRGVACISNINELYYEYVFNIIEESIDKLKAVATGSVILGLSKDDINNLEVYKPTLEEIEKFHIIEQPILNRIIEIKKQNKTLEQIRDTLLPKLMNGEIDLDKIEI